MCLDGQQKYDVSSICLCCRPKKKQNKKHAKMHKVKIMTSNFLLCCAGNQPFITRIRDCWGHSGTVMWSVIKMQNADVPATLALEAARVNCSENSCSTCRFWSVHKQVVNMILSLLSLNFVDAVWFVELDITSLWQTNGDYSSIQTNAKIFKCRIAQI